MTGNQINDFVKYFTLTSIEYGTGSKIIKFKFTDMNNTGTIKIFTEDGSNVKQPTITLQEIGDQNIKTILDETRGSKTNQIAKVLVNTNANVSSPVLLNTSFSYELHSGYTPSVSDTGTIIIIVNFALYISFHSNLTSEVKLELLLNNGSDTNIPQERTITLKEMASNRSYEYTKYFSISKSDFGTGKIELKFTDMNNSGNITLFRNDNSTVKKPTVTIQEIGSTTGWGSTIENIQIGKTTSADASFNKVVIKNNLDVSGNINLTNSGIIQTTGNVLIGTTSNTNNRKLLVDSGDTEVGTLLAKNTATTGTGNNWNPNGHTFDPVNYMIGASSAEINPTDNSILNKGDNKRAFCWAVESEPGSYRALGLFANHTDNYSIMNTASGGFTMIGWFKPQDNNNSFSFTASHRCFSNDTLLYNDDKIGLIVQSTGTYDSLYIENIEIDNAVPIVEICNKKKSKSVLGIIAKYEKDGDSREGMDFGYIQISKKDKNRLYINGIGEGGIWVCNTNGNFENGDYIQSSNVTGYGEKQDDDLLHNYSVGKITMDVDFNNIATGFQQRMLDNGVIAVFVGCIYYCG